MSELEPVRFVQQEELEAGLRAAADSMGKFNLAIFGLTGVGKSTLLNAVFGQEHAPTGIGAPVTQDSKLYRTETSLLGIFDTKGLEVGSQNRLILQELRGFVEANRLGDLNDQIHVIWYCFRAGDRRIQPAEVTFIQQVAQLDIPVLVVMTQTPKTPDGSIHADALELARELENADLPIRGRVHLVNALGDDFDGIEPFGLDELIEATATVAPEGVKNALAASQRVSRKQKRTQAQSLIVTAEKRLAGKVFLRDIGPVWAELFAGIATVYDLPEDEVRAVWENARSVKRLRTLLQRTRDGLFVIVVAPVPGGLAVTLGALAARTAFVGGGLLANKMAKRVQAAGEIGTPVAWADNEDEIPVAAKQRVGSGFAAGQVTRAVGESWLATCDHYWAKAFPGAPVDVYPQEMATYFADDLYERLPAYLKKWEDRARRKAAAADGDG